MAGSKHKVAPGKISSEQKSWNGILVYAADAQSGKTLIDRGGDVPHDAASLTKMMTFYLTLETLQQRHVDPSKAGYKIPVSSRAASAYEAIVTAGEELPLPKALGALMTNSDNGVAVALSEWAGGDFVQRMNDKAKTLGLTNTRFYNVNGLPPAKEWTKHGNHPSERSSGTSANRTTPRDMAMLVARLGHDFPEATQEYMGANSIKYGPRDKEFEAHHRLNDPESPLKVPDGYNVIAKTGFTQDAGHNIASKVIRPDGKQMVIVVMGSGWVSSEDGHKAGVPDGTKPDAGTWYRGNTLRDALVREMAITGALPDIAIDPPRPHPPKERSEPEHAPRKSTAASVKPLESHGVKPHSQGSHRLKAHGQPELEAPALALSEEHQAVLSSVRRDFQHAMETGGTPSAPAGKADSGLSERIMRG